MEWNIPLLERCQCHDFHLIKKLQWGDKLKRKRKVKEEGEECKGTTKEVKKSGGNFSFMQGRENQGKVLCEKILSFSCFGRYFYQVQYMNATFSWTRFVYIVS